MPFFAQPQFSAETALFHFLSELEQPRTEPQKQCGPRRHHPQETFTPRFDVAEVADAYELFGEVAGLDSSNLSIEFSDAKTLVIKGKTERSTTSSSTSQLTQEVTNDASSEKSDETRHATVEDDYDEADTPLSTPATTSTAVATDSGNEKPKMAQAPKSKYWVSERKVGSFARTFSFSQRIDQDAVSASLKTGILHVVVPKSQKPKRVSVSVN